MLECQPFIIIKCSIIFILTFSGKEQLLSILQFEHIKRGVTMRKKQLNIPFLIGLSQLFYLVNIDRKSQSNISKYLILCATRLNAPVSVVMSKNH
jgi:hypothetical protein